MKTLVKLTAFAALLIGAGALAYPSASGWWARRNAPEFRTAETSRGTIVFTVNSTGTINPVKLVSIGSFVSGPIAEVYVDFNDHVKQGQMLAKIDPRLYEANVARDRAALATQKAEVVRVQAQLQQAINDEQRSLRLRKRNADFISDTEMDQFRFSRMALEAQLTVAKAAVEQSEASLQNSMANLGYTNVNSPVDGIVINRKVDPGQTLAASFQTPELFTIAPGMDQLMHVFASVDEADIGLIHQAQKQKLPVKFTVDAYPDDVFTGEIYQIRKSSTTDQNVVTYPVVIAAPNPDLKLLPGMTANIDFEVETRKNVLRIPNAALLFLPKPDQVRAEDRHLVERSGRQKKSDEPADPHRRQVWVADELLLRAVPVRTGISDGRFTEMVEGELQPDQPLVTGVEDAQGGR